MTLYTVAVELYYIFSKVHFIQTYYKRDLKVKQFDAGMFLTISSFGLIEYKGT